MKYLGHACDGRNQIIFEANEREKEGGKGTK